MKKLVTKADVRADLEREIEQFLDRGGEVKNIPTGLSGNDPLNASAYHSGRLFLEPRTDRTLVPEVIAAIEARRKAQLKRTPQKKPSRLPQRRRKTIFDDFGEPLRTVWVDE